jgi:streptogramin lyase
VLAAVLFTDIESSTSTAEELGDKRWHALVGAHNRIMRKEIKARGGVELDTAGDGFFASFPEPASAIGCACAVSEQTRELGIAIRAGVHFGECEPAGEKLGGISVVIGARIMGLGTGGDVLVSGTAAELAHGAGFCFEDQGMHHLKGVEGEWRVLAVTSVDGAPRSPPLDPEEARARRAGVEIASVGRRNRALILGAAIVGLGLLVGATLLLTRGSEPITPTPGDLARVNADGTGFDAVVPLGTRAIPEAIAAGRGRLWVASLGSQTLAEVDPEQGSVQLLGTTAIPTGVAYGAERVWVTYGFSSDPGRVDELDPAGAGGLRPAPINVPAGSYPIAATPDGVWVADPLSSSVGHFDPITGRIATVALPDGSGPVAIAADPGGSPAVWLAAGRTPTVFRIDGPTATPAAFNTGLDVPSAIAVAFDGTVWVVSSSTAALIALAPDGSTKLHRTISARCLGPDAIAATGEAVFVSCGDSRAVVRIDPTNGAVLDRLPVAGTPGPLGIDEAGRVWVGVRTR